MSQRSWLLTQVTVQTGFGMTSLDNPLGFTCPPYFYFSSPNPGAMDIKIEETESILTRFGFLGARD